MVVRIFHAVVIVVRVGVVADAVTVAVQGLARVERQLVLRIFHAVVVVVGVLPVFETVVVRVARPAVLAIRHAVAVVVIVRPVADAVPVRVELLARIVRESVPVIAPAVAVGVDPLAGIERETVFYVGTTVVVVVAVRRVADAVAVRIAGHVAENQIAVDLAVGAVERQEIRAEKQIRPARQH